MSEHSVHPEVFGKEYEWVLWIEIIVEGIEEEKSRAWAYHYAASMEEFFHSRQISPIRMRLTEHLHR